MEKNFDFLLGNCFSRYSKYIIQERALPDIRDGLKPVHRRIIFAMEDLGLNHSSPFKKSARIVGEVIGKYHPHGDTSVYDSIVRMSQKWKMRYPLILMHGNNGSIDGDNAAAMRYTEIKLEKISNLVIGDLKKGIVKMNDNFDNSELEPSILPSKIPLLLMNGSSGIASGYATEIPPHNITELLKSSIALINNPGIKINKLMKIVKGPDFPTGGTIHNISGLNDAYHSGKGKIQIVSKYNIISKTPKKSEIIITEIPYNVQKISLVKDITNIVEKENISQVKDIKDYSDNKGLKIIIYVNDNLELSKKIINILLSKTSLSINYNFNMIAIKDKKPCLVNLKEMLESYILFQKQISIKSFKKDLSKCLNKLNVVTGLIKAISILDDVINLIRKSSNRSEAIMNLEKRLSFNNIQATAIVDLKLHRLTSTDINLLIKDKKELKNKIIYFKSILNSDEELNKFLISQMQSIIEGFSCNRRTIISENIDELPKIKSEHIIFEENVLCVVTRDGYLKNLNPSLLKNNSIKDLALKNSDVIIYSRKSINTDYIAIFTNKGSIIAIPIHKIPILKISDQGIHLSDICSLNGAEKAIFVKYISKDDMNNLQNNNLKMVVITKLGKIKTINFSDLNITKKKALPFIKLAHNDYVVRCLIINDNQTFVSIFTSKNNYINFPINDIPNMSFISSGVRSMKLKNEEYIVEATLLNTSNVIGILTNNFKIELMSSDELIISKRDRVPKKINIISKNNQIIFVINKTENIFGICIEDSQNFNHIYLLKINALSLKESIKNYKNKKSLKIVKIFND